MEFFNGGIWHLVVNAYIIPSQVVDGKNVDKPFKSWSVDEIRGAKYDFKAMNIIPSYLNYDEFFRVSACTTAKEMWDLIKVLRKLEEQGIQEYKTFWMQQGETIRDIQKWFTRIVNHLKGLGKVFEEEELNVKILKSLNRTWKPKVKIISETKDLISITHVELFGKLRDMKWT
ncbi:hypothetical protein HKD37_05G012839 [Glycine soja]